MGTLSPVAMFVYNRPEHTRKTLEALLRNSLAAETILYVFSDGPFGPDHQEIVDQVRYLIRQCTGFKNIHLIERDTNYGLARSITNGIDVVLSDHPSVIVLEDDLVTSPYFLQFMNDALNMYADNPLVASIQGYLPPLGIHLPNIFFLRYVGCWGWGTWQKGWKLFESDSLRLLGELKKKELSHKFNVGGYPFTQMLERQIAGELDSWAIRWHAALFLADKLSLYPGCSLVRNIGHDGSGMHCSRSSHFDVFLADKPIMVDTENPIENTNAHKALANYFRNIHPGLMKYSAQSALKLFQKLIFQQKY